MVELLPKLLQGYIFCKYYGWRGEGGMVMGQKKFKLRNKMKKKLGIGERNDFLEREGGNY